MVRMGLKEPEHQDRTWSHPPKKKWIYNYLTVGDEAVEETLSEERVKKPLVYRRAVEPTYTRNAQDPYPRLVQHAHSTPHQKGTLSTTTYQRGAPTPPHQQRGAPTPPHQQRGAPTPPHQQRSAPTPPHQQQQRGAPTPPHQHQQQQRGAPTPPHQHQQQQRGAPTPPHQQRGAPTPPQQQRGAPTPPQLYQRGAPTPPHHQREQLLHIQQQQHPVVASISSPPVSRTTQPSSPVHIREEPQQQRRRSTLTPPTAGLVTGVWGLNTSIQQSSPRPSLSYPGSPAASPPRATLITRAGQPSPIGLVSAFRHESVTPPAAGTVTTLSLAPVAHTSPVNSTSDSPEHMQAYSRLPPTHDTYHSHLHNGLVRPNGLTSVSPVSPAKSLSPTGLSMNGYSSSLYSPDDKDDKKNRSGSTPSREVHNKLEKNRRAHLKECFETLRRQLPSMDDKKISNQTILKAAHRHIQNLKRKEREYEHEMERLAREKIAHQQHLATLKKELSAKWDHIDFNTLLPDMASLDQQRDKETKSTTTASEQPDMDEDDMVDAGTQATPVITAINPRLTSPSTSSVVPTTYIPPTRATSTVVNAATIAISNTSSRPISPHVQTLTSRGTTVFSSSNFSSSNPPITTITTFTPTSLTPVNCLTPGPTLSFTHTTTSNGHIGTQPTTIVTTREFPTDPNQPLNLSTNFGESSRSSPSLSRSPSIAYQMNGEYPIVSRGHIIKEELDIKEEMGGQMGGWVVAESQGPPGSVTLSRASGGEYTQGTALGPIVSSSGGIQLPAGLVAGGVQINGATGGLLGQPAIQVITPDGCKLLPATAQHGDPGKPLTITLAHAGDSGIEGVEDVSSGGPGAMMALALHKNGALHLAAVPSSARQVTQTQVSVGAGGVVTSVPLNLSVGSGGTAVRVTQPPTSIIPTNYLPITHANGISQLVGNVGTLMSPIMAPIMVSGAQQQRTVTTGQPHMASQPKAIKTGGHSSVPLVPTQYATSLPHHSSLGGLVKPVVMVSASNVMPVQHGTVATITSKP